jgi:hypothetical protein
LEKPPQRPARAWIDALIVDADRLDINHLARARAVVGLSLVSASAMFVLAAIYTPLVFLAAIAIVGLIALQVLQRVGERQAASSRVLEPVTRS